MINNISYQHVSTYLMKKTWNFMKRWSQTHGGHGEKVAFLGFSLHWGQNNFCGACFKAAVGLCSCQAPCVGCKSCHFISRKFFDIFRQDFHCNIWLKCTTTSASSGLHLPTVQLQEKPETSWTYIEMRPACLFEATWPHMATSGTNSNKFENLSQLLSVNGMNMTSACARHS